MPVACLVLLLAAPMSVLRALVSRNKRRYREGGFDLDLSYIGTDQKIIAMGFPADKVEGIYRNPIDEVFRFLETHHKNHYKIYNLCSERHYDHDRFHGRVAEFPFEDHNPPMIETIGPFCDDVNNWLERDCKNVVAIHCKAGKGRTGVMICAFLVHSGRASSPEEALRIYAQYRTSDLKGVTIPSQRRYVEYYGTLVSPIQHLHYSPVRLNPVTIILSPPPSLNGSSSTFNLIIYQNQKQGLKTVFKSEPLEVRKNSQSFEFQFRQPLTLSGDVKFEFKSSEKIAFKSSKSILFSFWFNTYFLSEPPSLPPSLPHSLPPSLPHSLPHSSINGAVPSSTTCNTSTTSSNLSKSSFYPPSPNLTSSRELRNHHSDHRSESRKPHSLDIPKEVMALQVNGVNHEHQPSGSSSGRSDCTRFWSECQERRFLSLKKDDLDRAHKDKNHKKFPKDLQIQVYFVKSLETGLSGNDSSSSLSGGSDDMTTNMTVSTKERSKQSKGTDLLAPNDGPSRAVSYHDGGIGLHRCRIGNARGGTHSDSEMPEDETETETSSEEEIGAVLS